MQPQEYQKLLTMGLFPLAILATKALVMGRRGIFKIRPFPFCFLLVFLFLRCAMMKKWFNDEKTANNHHLI